MFLFIQYIIIHIANHTKLNIILNNESYTIPQGIGIIPNECIYWLHTHDTSGIIHIESPVKTSFALDQFLDVWKALDNSNLITLLATNNFTSPATINVLINGKQLDLNHLDYRDIKLRNNDEISLRVTMNQ